MIRVLRVLEYEYEDLDAYEYDSSLWTTSFNSRPGASNNVKMVSQTVRISELGDSNDS